MGKSGGREDGSSIGRVGVRAGRGSRAGRTAVVPYAPPPLKPPRLRIPAAGDTAGRRLRHGVAATEDETPSTLRAEAVRLVSFADSYIVWRAVDAAWLRVHHRLLGRCHGEYASRDSRGTLPLVLTWYEARYVEAAGLVPAASNNNLSNNSKNSNSDDDDNDELNSVRGRCSIVWRDLHRQGMWLTSGSKYGADFLVYQGDPERHHSFAVVHVMRWHDNLSPTDLASSARLANKVNKTTLIAAVQASSVVRYLAVSPVLT